MAQESKVSEEPHLDRGRGVDHVAKRTPSATSVAPIPHGQVQDRLRYVAAASLILG